MSGLTKAIDVLVYASVALGVVLLLQLRVLVPAWLFYSVLTGWFIYLLVSIGIATGHRTLYPAVALLAVVTLLVSLPQPEHYSYVTAGSFLPSLTFLLGSALQIAILVQLSIYYLKRRRSAPAPSSQSG
jgi:hypothetical protein